MATDRTSISRTPEWDNFIMDKDIGSIWTIVKIPEYVITDAHRRYSTIYPSIDSDLYLS